MPSPPKLTSISTRQAQIGRIARLHRNEPIKTLSKHLDSAWMHEAYRRTRKDGAAGVDGQTAKDYAADLVSNLEGLLERLHTGATYRAQPVRRTHIPKGDGSKTRPIGIPTFEDKIAQRAVVMLLEPLYEQDFYNFSYGFRPGRSPHDAVKALGSGLYRMGGGWVLEVDVQSFFDTLDHAALRELLSKRIADRVVLRLVGKWLRAGVLDAGVVTRSDSGTPQGGVLSPLLANIYLHEVLDRWWVEQVQPRLTGRSLLVRYADDFVMAFSSERDARRVQVALARRFARFGLTLHPEKTRLVPFRRPRDDDDDDDPKRPGPGCFDFLGFRYLWAYSRDKNNWFIQRKTAPSRMVRALRSINQWLRRHRHKPVAWQARMLRAKLQGHFNYYGVRSNANGLRRFKRRVVKLWKKWLSRRSQRAVLSWKKFKLLLKRHPLPRARLPDRATAPRQLRLTKTMS